MSDVITCAITITSMHAQVHKGFTRKHFQGKLLTCPDSKGMSKGVFELQGTGYSQNLALLELNRWILRFFQALPSKAYSYLSWCNYGLTPGI